MKNKIKNILMNILYHMQKPIAHKILYFHNTKKFLNLTNPKNFNEKIHYLIVYKYGKKESILADKIQVKKYIISKNINNLYIPKALKIYNNVNDIDLNELPSAFVLKCNHGSGDAEICDNKKTFDFDLAKKKLNKALKTNFAKNQLEYHYKYIKPYVFAEEYLFDSKNKNPIDYKFYCKGGKVKSILVCSQREKGLKLNEYDTNWNELEVLKKEYKGDIVLPKPKKLKDMIKISEKISADFPFVRVDLYEINEKIYFGELTFTPAGGFCHYYDESSLLLHADLIDITDYNK